MGLVIRIFVWLCVGLVTTALVGNVWRVHVSSSRWMISSITSLDGAIGPSAMVCAMNNRGQIAGKVAGSTSCPVLWSLGSAATEVAPLDRLDVVRGINNHGAVAGAASAAHANLRAAVWRPDGTLTLLNLPSRVSRAEAVNDDGKVVGMCWNDKGQQRPFVWDASSGFQDLSQSLNPTLRTAHGINNAGWIVGQRDLADCLCGYVYIGSGAVIDLDSRPDRTSCANALNNIGQVVGYFRDSEYAQRAFLWERETGLVDLNSLLPPGSSWELHSAVSINDRGEIIGSGKLRGEHAQFMLQLARR